MGPGLCPIARSACQTSRKSSRGHHRRPRLMKRIPLGPLYYEFSRHNEPRLRIEPGETLIVESEDAFSGQIRTNADRRDKTKKPYGNPQTGPIYIEGAQAGDALVVT